MPQKSYFGYELNFLNFCAIPALGWYANSFKRIEGHKNVNRHLFVKQT